MTNPNDLQQIMGGTAVANDGDKIGKIGQIYLDDQTGQPVWVTVHTGLFGNNESFAPLYGSTNEGDTLRLAVSKDKVKGAPNVDADGHLEDNENDALYRYYADDLGQQQAAPAQGEGQYQDAGADEAADAAVAASGRHEEGYAGDTREDLTGSEGVVGHDTSGPTTDDAMTRSEERLHVGTEQVQAGRARLRKYIVEENVTATVPVSHEEVRVVREPITDANAGNALGGAELSEEEHEVTLHAERPVVAKETVPVERVRLDTETVTEQAQVDETVRKEQIHQVEVDGDARVADDRTGDDLGATDDVRASDR